jgi:preprotein translocase subunit SecA
MFSAVLTKIFGTHNQRMVRRLQPLVDRINALEPEIQALTDDRLRAQTDRFRQRLHDGERLDDLLAEAFATVREASRRVLGMRHFDVQLIGGMVLHQGKIAEMKTGEGKTLVATLPVYLNALLGRGVHVVTVNDYLASRDAAWMGRIYEFLGMRVGTVVHGLNDAQRKEIYRCDVTYGTNNEFGFDYLRDNMKYDLADYVQRPFYYAIVDEVDSILIDEARTPLIISGPTEDSTDKYYLINQVIPHLERGEVIPNPEPGSRRVKEETGDYVHDEEHNTVALTDQGTERVEKFLAEGGLLKGGNLYDPDNMELVHHVNQALRAHKCFTCDVDYVVKDGLVVIVDEFTGRMMPGRRYSDGLHQALEAKEGLTVANENQTLASITFQNYFRLYEKLAGMTGTAQTEAAEFHNIYKLDVVAIPTHMPMIRRDQHDVVYRTVEEKERAIVQEIQELHTQGQPVLVGTISIEKSERLAARLKKADVPHNVLNAKHHEREAEIVAQAGRYGAVTIATNMAGRGTDIMLGGNPEFLAKAFPWEDVEGHEAQLERYRKQCVDEKERVLEAGGLYILGTERHESRRIDNQLRGRSGRQGDPGASRFYLSLEDDLLRIFGSDRISGLMQRLGMEEDVPIENRMVSRSIENAQTKVEARNFEIRKHLLEYDDVLNQQRQVIYAQRRKVLEGDGIGEDIDAMLEEVLERQLYQHLPPDYTSREWDPAPLATALTAIFGRPPIDDLSSLLKKSHKERMAALLAPLQGHLNKKRGLIGPANSAHLQKMVMLQYLDGFWKDHLLIMDHVKEGIGLRGYGQRNPLIEYKKEGYKLFQAMSDRIKEEVIRTLFHLQIRIQEPPAAAPRPGLPGDATGQATAQRREPAATPAEDEAVLQGLRVPRPQAPRNLKYSRGEEDEGRQPVRKDEADKVGRNEPCPCGSGKKYKKCHGARMASGA